MRSLGFLRSFIHKVFETMKADSLFAFTAGLCLGAASIFIALGFSLMLGGHIPPVAYTLLVAPAAEEAIKAIFLLLVFPAIRDERSGAFLGASVGMGFGLMENLGYYLVTNDIPLLLLRSMTTLPLHVAATSLVGWGLGIGVSRDAAILYILAVLAHIAFNLMAVSASVLDDWLTPLTLLGRILLPICILVTSAYIIRNH